MLKHEFLSLEDVVYIHDELIRDHGGLPGISQQGLDGLESALTQPGAVIFGEEAHPTVWQQTAAYLYYIAAAQHFADGNKRTAIACVETFLYVNGYALESDEDELFKLAIQIGDEKVKLQKDDVAQFLRSRIAHDPEHEYYR